MKKKVIITIPAYNEESTIGKVIRDIKNVMNRTKYDYQILVVDDGSTDRTKEIARKENVIIYSHQYNRGLAETFRSEMKKCLELKADIIVHIDADSQYLPKEIPKLIKGVEKGYDLVLGSRFMGHIEYMPLIKRLGNRAFSRLISKIIKTKITDCQTGFRAFNMKIAKLPVISSHTYTQEIIIRSAKNNLRIIEIPIYFAKRFGKSKLMKNPLEYAFKAWINIFRIYRDYEPLKFFGMFGGSFFLAGLAIGIYFLYLHLTIGIKGHLGLLFLMLILLFSGLQIILFGFLADMRKK